MEILGAVNWLQRGVVRKTMQDGRRTMRKEGRTPHKGTTLTKVPNPKFSFLTAAAVLLEWSVWTPEAPSVIRPGVHHD
jgi:hypothetical protein